VPCASQFRNVPDSCASALLGRVGGLTTDGCFAAPQMPLDAKHVAQMCGCLGQDHDLFVKKKECDVLAESQESVMMGPKPMCSSKQFKLLTGVWIGLGLTHGLLAQADARNLEPVFPLRACPQGRYLEDRSGRPFLYQADTAWMLFLNLSADEAEAYFTARKHQGFTAVQVMLTGFLGMTNRDGHSPFLHAYDFAQPNEAFFAHVDRIMSIALSHKLALAVAPLWSGCCGEGWAGRDRDGQWKPLDTNGPVRCRQFGEWIGHRFGHYPHLIWILGGDNDPGDSRESIRALAQGLKEAAPAHLLSFHPASSHSSTEVWPGENWISFPMVYTYFRGFNKAWNKNQPDAYEISWTEYGKAPARPFFLGESTYEGEHDAWGSPLQARKQAYGAMLAGACGHAYGSPMWRCAPGWRAELDRPGAQSLKHLAALFARRPWWQLAPDMNHELVLSGHGAYATNDYAVAAVARDGGFGMVYVPSPRALTVNLDRIEGRRVQAWWFNPSSGQAQDAGTFLTAGNQVFTPPTAGDWILVLDNKDRHLPQLGPEPSVKKRGY
jgi:hypothetical protein